MKTHAEMYEASFLRPRNFFQLTPSTQWEIDKALGLLDWEGIGATGEELTPQELRRVMNYYVWKDEAVDA